MTAAATTTKARLARPLGHQGESRGVAPKIFIATPCYGGAMTATTANGLINLCCSLMASGLKFERCFPANESLIPRGRNLCVHRFLESDCTHLMFIDSDVGFRPKDFASLLDGDWPVAVGAYPKKVYGWALIAEAAKQGCPPQDLARQGALWASNVVPNGPNGEVEVIQKNGHPYVEVHDANTGWMLIKRHVLEEYITKYRDEIEYEADIDAVSGKAVGKMWNVFHAGIAGGTPGCPPRYLSEDYWFCRKWQEMGGKIYLALDTELTHSGFHTFTGDIGKMLQPIEPSEPVPPENTVKVDVEFAEPDAA